MLIENTTLSPAWVAEHGLSLLVETAGQRVLFDTGASAAFADNAERMGIDLSTVDAVVLSHGHVDHGGGLSRFLELNSHAPVWVSPYAFEPHYNASGRDIGLTPVLEKHPRIRRVREDGFSPMPGIRLFSCSASAYRVPVETGGMTVRCHGGCVAEDFRHELYMQVEEAGLRVLFSGCTHRGILNIADWFSPDVLVGGFHLMRVDAERDAARLRKLAEALLEYPTVYYTGHCTGDAAFRVLKTRMDARLHAFSTGQVLHLS